MDNIDKSNFRQFILQVPSQFKEGIKLARNITVEGKFDSLTISGVGGSALPANLLRTYCNSLFKSYTNYKQFETYINRYYHLPLESHSSLNIVASYSGNTEEALSSLEELKINNLPFIGISSGGELEKICNRDKIPHIKLPIPFSNYQPRMGTGYFFGAIFQLLVNHNLLPDLTSDIIQSSEKLNDYMEEYENKGKYLSQKLKGKTPVIYSSLKYKSVAMVWKIKINENAKTPAFYNFFPELNHNEMVGFTNPQGKFILIMLKDNDDNPRNLKRYEATAQLLKNSGIESEIIEMSGHDVFSKMFLSLMLADWTSYYLALEYKQDPTPVDMVEKLKKIISS